MQIELSDLLGLWQLQREILHDDGTSARFEGEARWTPDGSGAQYIETGKLHLSDTAAFTAERRYRWDADLSVWFDDGRFFHKVPPAGEATHLCAPDTYVIAYAFEAWPDFRVDWRVTGPRKAYSARSLYRR